MSELIEMFLSFLRPQHTAKVHILIKVIDKCY